MTTSVAVGISSPIDEDIDVKMNGKENKSKGYPFSGMNRKASMKGKRLLPAWGLSQACFQPSDPLLPSEVGDAA